MTNTVCSTLSYMHWWVASVYRYGMDGECITRTVYATVHIYIKSFSCALAVMTVSEISIAMIIKARIITPTRLCYRSTVTPGGLWGPFSFLTLDRDRDRSFCFALWNIWIFSHVRSEWGYKYFSTDYECVKFCDL